MGKKVCNHKDGLIISKVLELSETQSKQNALCVRASTEVPAYFWQLPLNPHEKPVKEKHFH